MKKRVLVTGAAGFIGFHSSLALQKRGWQVLGMDSFTPYYSIELKRARAGELAKRGIEVIEQDLVDEEGLERLFLDLCPTHVLHLAAQAGVRYSITNPQSYVRANLQGFVALLERCKEVPDLHLVYASSSSVYGRNKETPFSTRDRTEQQASLYGATKRANELFASVYNHLYGLSSIGLRYFTVYGPWGRPDMAYFHFCEKIAKGEPIVLFNEGEMERDFTYIDDAVQGTLGALERRGVCEVFNIGNHRPERLTDFVVEIERAMGKEVKKQFAPMQMGDVVATYAEIEESREKLGFSPKTTIREGIASFVEWFRGYHASHHSLSSG